MTLDWVAIQRVRNISDARLTLNPGVNLVTGHNGSGKTSLLEAIHILSSARSFRSQSMRSVIQQGRDDCLVRGSINGRFEDAEEHHHEIGIVRDRQGNRRVRVDQQDLNRLAELARLVPTLVLGGDTAELISGPPDLRRKFLNWGVFHVEHSFQTLWNQGMRCLRQYHAALQTGDRVQIQTWRDSLVTVSSTIDAMRQRYMEQLVPLFTGLVSTHSELGDVSCRYRRGWSADGSLATLLSESERADRENGYTSRGFQRADVRIQVNGLDAGQTCSRGEIKLLAWFLLIAQGRLAGETTPNPVIHLVDDPAAELDEQYLGSVLQETVMPGGQVVVTGTDASRLTSLVSPAKMFHVEHGEFEERV